MDKIKLIDSSCNYIENLKNRVSKLEEQKSVSSKSTARPLNKIEQDQWYIKGLFNGSIELIVFLIDGIKGRAATLSNFIRFTSELNDNAFRLIGRRLVMSVLICLRAIHQNFTRVSRCVFQNSWVKRA